MGQATHHRVAYDAQLTAARAPAIPLGELVGFDDPARPHYVVLGNTLAGDGQPEAAQQAERTRIRAGETTLTHVEALFDGQCENFHQGR